MIITKKRPASRSQEVVEYDNGRVSRLCYAPHNPHYFKNNVGRYKKIELFPENVKSKMDISLWDKNIVSMGLKRNGDGAKYIGYRPDSDQSGAEQLEFTLLSVKLDNELQKIEEGEPSRIDTGIQSVGKQIAVTNNRQGSRQCWRVERPIKDFEIRYKLNVKGMIIKPFQGEFWFYSIKTGEFRFKIKSPSILDVNFKKIPVAGLTHTLVKEGNELIYKKKNLYPFAVRENIYYIDAETSYSSTEDGFCWNYDAGESWATIRSAATSNYIDNSSDTISFHGSSSVLLGYNIARSFFMFDTTNITFDTIHEASLFIRSNAGSGDTSKLSAQQGTQGSTLTAADYSAFSGVTYGHTTGWAADGEWNEIEFNAQGISDITIDGITYICCREYDHDYLNVIPVDENGGNGYSTDETGTDSDPYLSIDLGWSHKIFGTGLYRSIMGINRANIKSVLGVPRS